MKKMLKRNVNKHMVLSIFLISLAFAFFLIGAPLANSMPTSMGPPSMDGPLGGGFYDQGIVYSSSNYLGAILVEASFIMLLIGAFLFITSAHNLDLIGGPISH